MVSGFDVLESISWSDNFDGRNLGEGLLIQPQMNVSCCVSRFSIGSVVDQFKTRSSQIDCNCIRSNDLTFNGGGDS